MCEGRLHSLAGLVGPLLLLMRLLFGYAVSAGPDVLPNLDLIPGIRPYSRISYQQKKLSTQYSEITLIRATSQTLAETQQAHQDARLSYLAVHQSNQQAMVEDSVICLMSLI